VMGQEEQAHCSRLRRGLKKYGDPYEGNEWQELLFWAWRRRYEGSIASHTGRSIFYHTIWRRDLGSASAHAKQVDAGSQQQLIPRMFS
jgi:hypothetical protein